MSNGYTSHGHAIPGVAQTGPRPDRVARCGGPMLCQTCKSESQVIKAKSMSNIVSLIEKHEIIPSDYLDEDPPGWGTTCRCGWRTAGNASQYDAANNFREHLATQILEMMEA